MSENDDTDRVRFSQVLAGALAAVTAALLGSTMGVAGTVVGAGLASVISTVGGALYLRSIQRTKESVRTVHAKVVGRSGGATVLVSADDPEEPAEDLTPGDEVEATPDDRPPEEPRRRRRWPVFIVTGLAAFALGMAVVTGVEWLRGESLSGSGDTTVGSIVDQRGSSGGDRDPADPTTSTTTPTPPTTGQNSMTTTDPTTTSSTPPSDSTTSTTTTEPPPPTTTTVETPAESAVPPSN